MTTLDGLRASWNMCFNCGGAYNIKKGIPPMICSCSDMKPTVSWCGVCQTVLRDGFAFSDHRKSHGLPGMYDPPREIPDS